MSAALRLIARLDVKDRYLVKGIQYEGLRKLGDPHDFALDYYRQGIDELLYLDTVASLYGRNNLSGILEQVTRDVFIPITAGGGLRNVEDVGTVLKAGADKAAINTAALLRPQLISEVARAFGSQCMVLSIQAKRRDPLNPAAGWEAYYDNGREHSGRDVLEWVREAQQLGAGEDPAHRCGPGGRAPRSGPGADPGGVQRGEHPGDRGRRRKQFRRSDEGRPSGRRRCGNGQPAALQAGYNPPAEKGAGRKRCGGETMHPTVTIVDYGRSNLLSVQRALEYCGAAVEYASTPEQVSAAGALVLPGVGAFADGMNLLRESGLARAVCTRARQGVPLLGICLGMQFLFDSSSEGGLTPGLGLLPGTVEAIPGHTTQGQPLRVPHIGWAPLYPAQQRESFLGSTLEAIPTKSQVYFVHGYRAMPARQADRLADTLYGGHRICAAVQRGNITGVQFHPEKSGEVGLVILRTFLGSCPA